MSADAQTSYYVRAGAYGAQNGSDWNNAYPSLPATFSSGAAYYIADGSYPGRTLNTPTSGTTLITIKKATAGDHGTDTGWLTHTGTVRPFLPVSDTVPYLDFESSYWIFDGVTGGGPGQWNSNFGFKISSATAGDIIRIGYTANVDYITIKHVEMQGKGSNGYNNGIGIYPNAAGGWNYTPSHFIFSYFWMHGIGQSPFGFADGVTDSLIEYTFIESYGYSAAIHCEVLSTGGGQNRTGDTTFRYNLVIDVQGTGALMWDNAATPTSHLYVYGNVFYRPFWRNME